MASFTDTVLLNRLKSVRSQILTFSRIRETFGNISGLNSKPIAMMYANGSHGNIIYISGAIKKIF
jgi:hypothetical protein